LGYVVSKDLGQRRRDGHGTDVIPSTVLEPAFLVGVAGVRPLRVDLGPRGVDEEASPTRLRKLAVLLA
jgi:hypothetical protein